MKKLLLLTCLIFTLSLKTQIHWNDLGNTFVGFYQEDQPEEIKKMSHYSPLFGALAFKSGDIKKDWLKAKDLDQKDHLVNMLFNYIEGDDNVTISRRSSDLLLSITPELIGHLLISLEKGEAGWENFKKNYAPQWQKIHIEAERAGSDNKHFFENIKTIKKSYDKFCHAHHKNKQKAREYFAALMCLKGETIEDIKNYLVGLGITTVDPVTLDDFTLKPINDFMEYELEILKYLSKSTINLYPKIIFNKVPLCVEQTIGDLINCILYNPTTKKLDLNYLPRDIQKNLLPEFKQFIETYSDGPNSFSQEKIDALVALLSDREIIQYDKLINDQRIEMISTLENFINVINLLFNTQIASFNEFGKLISSNNNSCSFEKISENQTKIVIKKQIQEEKSLYDQFIFGTLSIKKEHASFTLTEPEKNLTDEEVDQLLEKNKKFSSIVHTSRSFLSITGKALFYRSLKLANSSEKDEKIAADLIKEDIDVNSQETETLLTPLLVAIYYEAPANIIKLLIDYGADINIQAIDGKTPLHLALERSQDPENEILEIVLNAKPNVNIKDNTGRTPLNFIITEGISEYFFPIIKRLIALKAEINTTDNKGRSPLNPKKLNEEVQEYLTEELKKQTQSSAQPDDN